LPELPEQRAISHILAILDERIDLNRKMNATLEAIGQALFRSWFVDFDPVRAKAEGHSTGLPDHIAALFPDSFEEDEIGEHPRGWKSAKLGDILSVDKGVSYKGEHLGSGVPMINLGCFLGKGRFNASAIKRYSGDYKPRHTVPVGGLVVANTDITQRREVIGSPAIVPPIPGTNAALFTHHVFALRLDSSAPHFKLFVYFLLLNDEFRDRAMGFATGTTVLALPKDAILDLKYPSPPNELVTTFNRIAGPLKEMQWRNAEVSQSLTSLRDTLLPKLISGQIRVGEIGEAE
jgi:type I restriction enzyme S subunit